MVVAVTLVTASPTWESRGKARLLTQGDLDGFELFTGGYMNLQHYQIPVPHYVTTVEVCAADCLANAACGGFN
eukprot:601304-Amphidinium_carterae.1